MQRRAPVAVRTVRKAAVSAQDLGSASSVSRLASRDEGVGRSCLRHLSACCGVEDDRISSQLRPPLSGCDFAGELLCQERLLVQVQMQVLVMLPPQVLLRCYSVKCSGREGTPMKRSCIFLWIFCCNEERLIAA